MKLCPQGFTSAAQLLNLSLETWVELSSVQACVPCHTACLTCSGPGPAACLSCPPRSHLVSTSCLRQSLVQRKSPPPPIDNAAASLRGDDGAWQEVESSAGREEDAGGGGGEGGDQLSVGRPGLGSTTTTTMSMTTTTTTTLSSRLVVLLAVLGGVLLVVGCLGLVLLLLQTRAAGGSDRCSGWRGGGGLRTAEAQGGGRLGLRLGRDRKDRVCYRGIPTVWGDKDASGAGPWESESDGEEGHSERTAFIRTQSSV